MGYALQGHSGEVACCQGLSFTGWVFSCTLVLCISPLAPASPTIILFLLQWFLEAKIFPASGPLPSHSFCLSTVSDLGSGGTCSQLPDPPLKQLPHHPAMLHHMACLSGFLPATAIFAFLTDLLTDWLSLLLGNKPREEEP